MPLPIHQRYSIDEIFAAFGDEGEGEILCSGDFIVFPGDIVCCVTLGHSRSVSCFTSILEFQWRPQHLDYALKEQWPWFPEAVRETRNPDGSGRQKQHHLFARSPFDDTFFYSGPVRLSSYGRASDGVSAHFSLETPLPRQAWLSFGGSLSPRQPFVSLPASADHDNTLRFHRETLELLHIMPPLSQSAQTQLVQFERSTGIRLPAAVREWYSLMGCMEIMREISDIHKPARITDYDEDLVSRYRATAPNLSMLPIMYEYEGVWHIAVVVGADDDPPVYLGYQEEEGFEWCLHAQHFSDFVYAWA